MQRLGGQRIQTRLLWEPMHRSRALTGAYAHRIEVADWVYARALSLPSSVGLSEEQQDRVIAAILKELGAR